MGGDGGVVATQRKFMRGYKHPGEEAESKNIKKHQRLRSTICSVSSKPLVEPIVACELGNLYNKEEILSHLINKTLNESFKHVRGLKDLKTLKFKLNPIYSNNNNNSSSMDSSSASQFVCPVTGDEFNGALPFVCVWSTGYVLSERAIKELGIESLQSEYGPFNAAADLVKINPMLLEDIQLMKANMEIRRLMYAQQKKESSSSSSSFMNKRKREKITAEDGEVLLTDGTENMKIASSHHGKLSKRINSADHSMMMIQSPTHQHHNAVVDTQSFVSGFTTQHATSSHPHHQQPQVSSSSASSLKSMSSAHHIVKNVLSKEIERQTEQSQVYRGLFHKDHEADKKDRDLFMSVAGIRYTLS